MSQKMESDKNVKRIDGQPITSGSNQRAPTSIWKDLFAGGVAGTAGIAIGHPFDTIKVRLQQQVQRPVYPKMHAVILEGNALTYRGLFQGIGAPLAFAAVVNASVFSVYGATSRLWDEYYPDSVATEHSSLTKTLIAKHAVCGAVTGLTTSLVLSPIEHVKIRLQTMNLQPGAGSTSRSYSNKSSNSSFQLTKEIISSRHGFKGLYRGLLATILRQTPSLAVYFPMYHVLKKSISDFYNSRRSSQSTIQNTDSLWWPSALAGGMAGCLSWTIVYPIDAVKSRIQSLPLDVPAKERSFLLIVQRISRNEGFTKLIFSRGLAVTLLRAFPVNGTIFFVYESINQRLRPLNDFGWAEKNVFVDANWKPAGIETQLRTTLRRKITFRVDEAIVDVQDVSWRAPESH